jgi:peptidoglycan/LPS O-acetylase OafA/YrhL
VSALAATSVGATAAPAEAGGGPRRHLDAVDVVRMVMVSGVIAVHVIGYTTNPNDVLAGAVTNLLHVNREVFFVLSAFVLTYVYGTRRGWSLKKFWAKRYLYVGVPYLTWTVVYYFADDSEQAPWLRALHRFGTDVAQGTARYHLYFLLVTMQIYAVFPLLLWLLRATRRHHGALLAVCFGFQLGLTTVLHYRLPGPPFLGFWLGAPDPFLLSYVLYVVAGGVAGMHFEELTAWVRAHHRSVGWLAMGGLSLSAVTYCFDHFVLGQNVAQASEVFQPMVAVTTAAAVAGLFSLGVRWADRGADRPLRKTVSYAADSSFGIYLAHPLLLQVLLIVAAPIVHPAVAGHIPSWAVLPVDLLVVVPALFVLSGVLVRGSRHTALSLPFTGRPRLVRAPRTAQE